MSPQGIYTLANDVVADQLIALLNSIEQNVSPDIPICVIPFDDRLERVMPEVAARGNVTLFRDRPSIDRWEAFAKAVWAAYPTEKRTEAHPPWGTGHHRKFVAFDGPFEKFVFYDADSLAMKPLDQVFTKLDDYDFVFDDWEHRKSIPHAALDLPLIEDSGQYQAAEIRPKLHCSSFFGSKQGIFHPEELAQLQQRLIQQQEVAWVSRWWDDAFLFNYLTLRRKSAMFNFTLSPDGQDRTGNCADADPFITIDQVLYNEQGQKPIHRIHYMNYPAIDFTRLSQGEDVKIRYQDIFLHYRYLKEPEHRPKTLRPPNVLTKTNRKVNQAIRKFKRMIS